MARSETTDDSDWTSPVCLTVPGLGGATPAQWQRLWEQERADVAGIDLGCWDDPIRNVWLSRIDHAVGTAGRPVILVAHGLGCLAVAWWAGLLGKRAARRVAGALLVAPVDPEQPGADERIARFGLPTAMLPFPAILVASRTDPACRFERAREIAGEWVTDLHDAGPAGALDESLGPWAEGQRLLDILTAGGPGLSRYTYRHEPVTRAPRARTRRPAEARLRL
jgi:predicted alpha/beta hydrolase family esterase